MDNQNSGTSGPSLSQYFANDPPSFFDELASKEKPQKNENASLMSSTYNGAFKPPEYIESGEIEDDLKVPEEVRNFWEPPFTEPGIPPHLTMPGVMSPNDLSDPIREAVLIHLGESELSQRKILRADDVTQDERGLRNLIVSGCYRSAVNLTGRLLTIYGQGYGRAGQPAKNTPHSLQLWFTRLALLAKLGQYELLQSEAEAFDHLTRADVYYEFHPDMYNGKKGSMACFSFRLLLAELPVYFGNAQEALDKLSELYAICNEIKKYFKDDVTACAFWRRREMRVLQSIVNCAILMRKFNLIDDIIRGMILEKTTLTKEDRRSLFSAWGRIYLQIGDIFGAEQKFAEARRLKETLDSFFWPNQIQHFLSCNSSNSSPDLRDFVDKGLIAVAKNDFQEAFLLFQKGLQIESGNTMILNNMGVCLLYSGKLKDAINLFERAINVNPQKSLNENLLVNLSTLYELESYNSANKKLNLLKLVNKFKPDLNISLEFCLKLQGS